jgi:uncharacterized protein (TIGR02246 family)
MPRFRPLLPLLLVLAAAAGSAQEPEAPALTDASRTARDAVDAGNYFLRKAFEARDAQALADLYTEDARVIAPGAEPAEGRAAIAAFWQGVLAETQGVRLDTQGVEASGDLAVEDGVARLTANDGSVSRIRYVVVWKRVGRRWHLHRDIWNAGPAEAAEAGAPAGDAAPATAPDAAGAPPLEPPEDTAVDADGEPAPGEAFP